ncbi:DgyrCDS10733 [Dimorphilus gyrociliatus]|uniref:High affinity cGMP-specific 3',5'-cyclic phosphodiesterase 9A n=1 Tax=Dimorphilus gyrociliatus TaxID=2664684 RepID=A0A7I8W142_9ANNE|nr:DgyrCDS10733 [Dimorphilus gyrociliatus]
MQQKVEEFKQKLEGVEHLSWLGLFKDMSSTKLRHFWKKNQSIKRTDDQNEAVYKKFLELCKVQATEQVREYLKKPTFDNWQWEDAEIMFLLRQMYIDLGFLHTFNIEMSTLQHWLYEIYKNYNLVPFHNFKHCFMVAQMMYGLTWLIGLRNYVEDIDILILITSAICHDLNHPGYNNAYQINARTELALRYNDISPLENHHCAVAFEILANPNFNIFRNLDKDVFKKIREGMIKCILATDMAKHSEILSSFKAAIEKGFDFSSKEQKSLLLIILIKVADISNEARPMQVSELWAECLLEEFFMQSDMEKLEGLPVAPFMDREKVNKCTSQVGFIKFVLLPLFETLASLFPKIQRDIIEPVREALQYYQKESDSLEEENEKRKDSKNLEKIDVHLKRQNKNGLKTNSNS